MSYYIAARLEGVQSPPAYLGSACRQDPEEGAMKLIAAFAAALELPLAQRPPWTITPHAIIIVQDAEGPTDHLGLYRFFDCRRGRATVVVRFDSARFRGRRSARRASRQLGWVGADWLSRCRGQRSSWPSSLRSGPLGIVTSSRRRTGCLSRPRSGSCPSSSQALGRRSAGWRPAASSSIRRSSWPLEARWRAVEAAPPRHEPGRLDDEARDHRSRADQTRPYTGIKATARRIAQPTRIETKRLRGGPRTRRRSPAGRRVGDRHQRHQREQERDPQGADRPG